jgi:curved DNA-binding protein CbpA
VQKAYETLSDDKKRDEYDQQMGLGKAGQSQMQRGMDKARAAAYSDDEYNDLSEFQRRKRRGPRSQNDPGDFDDMGDESQYGMGSKNSKAQREFWDKVNNKDATRSRRER